MPDIADDPGPDAPERIDTPGVRTIADLAEQFDAAAHQQVKTMVWVVDDQVTLALVRGDHQLNEQKLADATGANRLRPATPDETLEHLGARPGSLGAVGVTGLRILADHAAAGPVEPLRRARTTTTCTCAASTSSATSRWTSGPTSAR